MMLRNDLMVMPKDGHLTVLSATRHPLRGEATAPQVTRLKFAEPLAVKKGDLLSKPYRRDDDVWCVTLNDVEHEMEE